MVDTISDPILVGLGPDPALDGAGLTGRLVLVNAGVRYSGSHGGGGDRQVGGGLARDRQGAMATLVAIFLHLVLPVSRGLLCVKLAYKLGRG